MIDLCSRIFKTGSNIIRLEVWKIRKYLRFRSSACQHLENVFYSDPHSANAWTAAALLGVERDPIMCLRAHKRYINIAPNSHDFLLPT